MPKTFDPRSAIVYFDLCFADYDVEQDEREAATDADAAARVKELRDLAPADPGLAAHKLESRAMNEVEALVHTALPGARFSNEGHDALGNLVLKVGVNSVEEARKLATLVARRTGGGEDCIYLDTPYFCVQGFRLYPSGVNDGNIALHDLEEALEDGALLTAPAA